MPLFGYLMGVTHPLTDYITLILYYYIDLFARKVP